MLCLASKNFKIVKATSPQIPTARVEFLHLSVLFGKPKQNAIFSKNVPPQTHLYPSI